MPPVQRRSSQGTDFGFPPPSTILSVPSRGAPPGYQFARVNRCCGAIATPVPFPPHGGNDLETSVVFVVPRAKDA
jgi:hypothetical protein